MFCASQSATDAVCAGIFILDSITLYRECDEGIPIAHVIARLNVRNWDQFQRAFAPKADVRRAKVVNGYDLSRPCTHEFLSTLHEVELGRKRTSFSSLIQN
jgi:hypothetical protein